MRKVGEMTNISGTGPLGAPQNFRTGQVDQEKRIQFENTLAAVKSGQTTGKQDHQKPATAQDAQAFSELLPQRSAQHLVPAQKVIASLTHLIQQNQMGSELDITS